MLRETITNKVRSTSSGEIVSGHKNIIHPYKGLDIERFGNKFHDFLKNLLNVFLENKV